MEPTTPPPSTPSSPTSSSSGLPVDAGQIVAVLGSLAVIVSIFLNWLDITISRGPIHFTLQYDSTGVPVQFLWDYTTKSNDPSLLIVLIPAVVLALAGAAIRARWLTFVGGALSILVAVLYSFQLHQGVSRFNAALNGVVSIKFSDLLGIAPIICAIGGVVILVGALIPATRGSSTG